MGGEMGLKGVGVEGARHTEAGGKDGSQRCGR